MGDHLISPEIVQRLMSSRRRGCVLCVDTAAWHPSQLDDGTRVMVGLSGEILSIGKRLAVWNAIDTGVFKMTRGFFPAIDHLMEENGLDVSITDVVRHMGRNGHRFGTCDVSSMFWADVDTQEDYLAMESLLKEQHGERV
jgi:1L-myo-inositol 1-phosphate cytidylyltransferase